MFPPDSEFMQYVSGIGRAILGSSPKFHTNTTPNWTPKNYKNVLIDMSMGQLMNVAQNVPHLNVVISRGAEMFANMEVRHVDAKGKEIENSPILKFLRKPNPLQKLDSFLYEYYVFHSVYSQAFMYANKGSRLAPIPGALWNLPGGWMKINLTGKVYDQIDIEGIVESYVFTDGSRSWAPNEITHIAQGIGMDKYRVKTKIEALQIPLSNIVAGLKSDNIILTERGLIGFVSHDAGKDAYGSTPPDMKEMQRISKAYKKNTSLDSANGHVQFTHAPVKWVPMSFDTKQLMLHEGMENYFGIVCGEMGMDRDIFPSTKGATNENKNAGLKNTYQNTMQPLANTLMEYLSDIFGLVDRNERLLSSYDWLPVMKEDGLKSAQTLKAQTDSVALLVTNNVINPGEARILMEKLTGNPIDVVPTRSPILDALTELSPLLANNVIGNLTINEVREMIGQAPITGGDELAKLAQAPEQGKPNSQSEE